MARTKKEGTKRPALKENDKMEGKPLTLDDKLDLYLLNHAKISKCFDIKAKNFYSDKKYGLFGFINSLGFSDCCEALFKELNFEPPTSVKAYLKSLQDDNKIELPLKIAVAVVTYKIATADVDRTDQKEEIDNADVLELKIKKIRDGSKKEKVCFRGQADSSWGLSPTLLRDFGPENTKSGFLIDGIALKRIYENSKLFSRSEKLRLSGKDLDYEFVSLMQHARSYSPLIDFTSSLAVAETFLCDKKNLNTFMFKGGTIFVAKVPDHLVKDPGEFSFEERLNDNPIYLINKSIQLGFKMKLTRYPPEKNENVPAANFETFNDAITTLTPKVVAFFDMTNDRMKVQQGCFLFFYGFACFQGNVFFQLNKEFKIFGLKVSASVKKKIDKRFPKGDRKNFLSTAELLDPYLLLNE